MWVEIQLFEVRGRLLPGRLLRQRVWGLEMRSPFEGVLVWLAPRTMRSVVGVGDWLLADWGFADWGFGDLGFEDWQLANSMTRYSAVEGY